MVLSCAPAAGSVVTADEQVTLVVAQPYTVPDVVGLSQDEAARVIGEAGLASRVEWQEAEGDSLTVLSTSPRAGERASAGATVAVTVVAPGASSEAHVADYLASDPRDVSAYLRWKGWSFEYGVTESGAVRLRRASMPRPAGRRRAWERSRLRPGRSRLPMGCSSEACSRVTCLPRARRLPGVRFEPALTGDDADPQVNAATVSTWATRCGLESLEGTLSGDDVARATAPPRRPVATSWDMASRMLSSGPSSCASGASW